MGGVYLSDQLIHYYTTQHKTVRWYRKIFLHFLDIAATNAYLLHKALMQNMHKDNMTHKAFLEELTAQLCGVTMKTEKAPVKNASNIHKPVCGPRANRKICAYCRTQGKYHHYIFDPDLYILNLVI